MQSIVASFFVTMYYVLLGFLLCAASEIAADPTVIVTQGELRGKQIQTHAGRNIFAFLGVPYAKPPLGELRFKEPDPPIPWEGTRDAKNEGNCCIQKDYLFDLAMPLIGHEDCLYLNVYTTQLRNDTETHPVLFYIHGGGWQSGRGSIYGPEYLLEHDVVLVTINYRLGPFGFLSTEDENSPGNYGLKDQVAALRWVKDNIAAFGGDPGKVTIAGQSAGGASVHYLMLSPLAKGLFQGAISMSGTVFAPWASARQPAVYARRLAKLLSCPEEPSAELVACLRNKDAALFVDGALQFLEWDMDPLIIFTPSIEPPHSGERFLPASLVDLVREAEQVNPTSVPWMLGMTADDGGFRAAVIIHKENLLSEIQNKFDEIGPLTLRVQETSENPVATAHQVKDFYFGNKTIDRSTKSELSQMYTDRLFLAPIDYTLKTMKHFNSTRLIYLYQVSHRGKHSLSEIVVPENTIDYGVCHLDELQYIFYMPEYYPAIPADNQEPDHQMMKLMTQLVADFVRTGKPTKENAEKNQMEDQFIWHPANCNAEFADLKLPRGQMIPGILHEQRRAFWRSLNLTEHLIDNTGL